MGPGADLPALRKPPGSLLEEDGHWKSERQASAEFVLAFNGDRPARISRVVLEAADDPKSLPGEIVLYLSGASLLRLQGGRAGEKFSRAGEHLEIPVEAEARF